MAEQLSIVPDQDPDDLINQARDGHQPVSSWCLFSGGNDSKVLAHRCRDQYQGLAFIDTGTALPGVVQFVEDFAAMLGKPLRILDAGDAYRKMVLGDQVWWGRYNEARASRPALTFSDFNEETQATYGEGSGTVRSGEHRGLYLGAYPHGFPGSGSHGRAYSRLKERQIEALVKREKVGQDRRTCVMLLSGKRKAESARRAITTKGIERDGGRLFVNPLIDWSNDKMARYSREHTLPESDAAALIHRSGECMCGAFAEPNERAMVMGLYPEWFERTMAPLEREAQRLGIPSAVWGEGPPGDGTEVAGNLCSSCEFRQESLIDLIDLAA